MKLTASLRVGDVRELVKGLDLLGVDDDTPVEYRRGTLVVDTEAAEAKSAQTGARPTA